jgi:hypothetical protein
MLGNEHQRWRRRNIEVIESRTKLNHGHVAGAFVGEIMGIRWKVEEEAPPSVAGLTDERRHLTFCERGRQYTRITTAGPSGFQVTQTRMGKASS